MNANSIQTIIKVCSKLDKKGHYSKADNLFEKIAQYYPQQSVTQSPNVSLVPYEDIEKKLNKMISGDKRLTQEKFQKNIEIWVEKLMDKI